MLKILKIYTIQKNSCSSTSRQNAVWATYMILCFLVRASSYIPISRPTDATCDRFLFSIYKYTTLHFYISTLSVVTVYIYVYVAGF
jgi:hypothetical protein